ncbi:hypothetical protein LTR22_027179 [Elasticomyces elasticus]|nr:hypothetical protein LTR22_027179 [Elasticomyces elasticus]
MDDTLVVGIDFGTTYSGFVLRNTSDVAPTDKVHSVAAAYSENTDSPDELNIIKSWPGNNSGTNDKVPTEIAYRGFYTAASTSRTPAAPLHGKRKFDTFSEMTEKTESSPGTMRWGYQIKPDEDRLRCLKLFLDRSQHIPDHVSLPDIRHQLMACGKDVGTIVAEYLSALFTYAKRELCEWYGEDFVATTKLTVVLTVPAVWSDTAKDATLKAAEAAGMGDSLAMVSEPEAAAIYTLQAMQPKNLRVGHIFVVIDAGGGTVDLISYRILHVKPLRLEEVAKGSGGFCGSTFLNVRFEQFMRERLGMTTFNAIKTGKPMAWLSAWNYFELHAKRNYIADEDDIFNIPLPGVADNARTGIDAGWVTMTSADLSAIFAPIIAAVIALVEGQLAQLRKSRHSVNGLVLVGGFGQSACLMKSLQSRFSTGTDCIEVLRHVNAQTAVVRGAVLRGLEGAEMVTSRKSRRHYGIVIQTTFDPKIHPQSCKVWDPLEESWKADDQMSWCIAKGARHTRLGSTRVACSTVSDLALVPTKLWKTCKNSTGRIYQRLSCDVGMKIESGALSFNFQVDKVVYGKAIATFK